MRDSRKFICISLPYLIFTITDGALRILTILAFHHLGFSPFQIASLFILYEVAGIFTNFLGGWIGSNVGLNKTLIAGLIAQVVALSLLAVNESLLSVVYVMIVQGLSGIAKDLIKVSSKSSVKAIVAVGNHTLLFKFVAFLTGSKNTLKGLGFLLGGVMLSAIGFQISMISMASVLGLTTLLSISCLPKKLGEAKTKTSFMGLFSKSRQINVLSIARFFLFGSRDIWFVIGLPIFLQTSLNWSFEKTSGFLALWIVGYGIAQTLVPLILNGKKLTETMGKRSLSLWTGILILFPSGIALSVMFDVEVEKFILFGLLSYGLFFAINSIIHSYLVLSYSSDDNVSTDVGFYYMANAMGRLVGTLLSGWTFQSYGFSGALWASVVFC